MDVTHALTILIKGKNLAGPALKDAGNLIAGLTKFVTNAGKGLVDLTKLGISAFETGISVPAQLAASVLSVLGTALGLTATAALGLGAALASVATAIASATAAATPYTAELEGMRKAFWGIAGEAAPAMLQALRESSAFMVTEKGLIQAYNQSYMLLGKTLSARLPEAFQYLSKVAVATGDNVEYLMERLVMSVGRLSTRWMAYIGTVVEVDEATARAAKMFGKAADELSREEIQAGMLDGVLKKLEARVSAMPDVLGSTTQMLQALRAGFKDLVAEWTTHFLPVVRSLYTVVSMLETAFRKLIGEGGALYIPIRKLSAAFSVLFDILGEVVGKVIDLDETASSRLEGFANRILSIAWHAIEWGATIVTNLAAGIIRGASQALTAAMNFVARLLEHWLAPGSAPLIVSNILDWGASAFTEFLRGFTMAQFDVLEGVQAPLKRALRVLTDLELLTPIKAGEQFIGLSEDLAAAIAEFGRTGRITGDIFEKLAAVGGGYGESIAELLRRQLDLATAVERLAAAEERLKRARDGEEKANIRLSQAAREYNKLVRQGADPAVLKAKLAQVEASYDSLVAAREETEAAEDAREAAADQVKEQQERVKLQERLLNQLIEMGQALVDLRKAEEREAEEGVEIPPIEWPDVYPVPIDQAFEDLKNSIRKKFEELWGTLTRIWEESGAYAAIQRLGEAWNRLKEAMAPVIDWLGEKWDALKNWWKENGPKISGWINEHLIQPLTSWISDDAWPWVVEQWDKWSAWWKENGPGIKQGIADAASAVYDWIKENVFDWAVQEWDKWVDWWEEDSPVIEGAVDTLKTKFGELLDYLEIEFTPIWDKTWHACGIAFQTWWKLVQIAAEGGMQNLRHSITLAAYLIQGDWEGAMGQLRKINQTNWDTLNRMTGGKLYELFQSIDSFVKDPMKFLAIGRDLVGKIAEGVGSSFWNLTSKVREAISDAARSALNAMWEFTSVGWNIITSIADSIRNNAWKVARALRDVIDDAIRAIRNALGLWSPSRVFVAIGEDVAESFALGIQQMSGEAALATEQMANMSIAATTGYGGAGAAPAAGSTYYITNKFGPDSVRSDRDIIAITEAIERSLTLRGVRNLVG